MCEIPLVRVGLGLAAAEELCIRVAAPAVDEARANLDLPPDPAGDLLREAPYFTMVPEPLEDPAVAPPTLTRRFAPGTPAVAPPLTDWWPGNDDPLVYLTFGSVTAGRHLPYFPALYRAAIAALAPLRARILVTIGDSRDHTLGGLRAAVARVVEEESYRREARRIAAAMRTLPPVEAVVDALAAIAARADVGPPELVSGR